MEDIKLEKLFILEMANNHMGDVKHGMAIISQFAEVVKKYPMFDFAFKFQYRNLDTFIHKDFKSRQDIKYIKRFEDTRLSDTELLLLKTYANGFGFKTICTPFDESSVGLILAHEYDVIKVASCSFTDWPLLEKIAKTDKPIILSTAGASLEDIDRVVTFLEHRSKKFALMHCVGEYPTARANYELNQIGFFNHRYPHITIGYSTHELPAELDAVKMAIAEGAMILERHVGIETERYSVNAYSSTPDQIDAWLHAAQSAFEMTGLKDVRRSISVKEKTDLDGLRRGVFAKQLIKQGERLTLDKVYYAIPNVAGQLLSNDLSKYTEFVATKDIKAHSPAMATDFQVKLLRNKYKEIDAKVKDLIQKSNIPLPDKFEYDLSHHLGLDSFEKCGCVIIRCINREYCKTIIVVLPGQSHPVHLHKKKEETFQVLYGNVTITVNDVSKECKRGDLVIVERGARHSFSSVEGAVFEEISTTHYVDDSFYDDERIVLNADRKSNMTFRSDWMKDDK